MQTRNKQNLVIIITMIFIAAATRFLPHPPNFTALGAMGLFGAAYFNKKYLAFIVPFIALFLSDLVINNVFYAQYYDGFVFFHPSSIWIYLGFAAIVIFGQFLLKKVNFSNVFLASLIASISFFVITNFGTWASTPMYTKDITGLIACFTAGLPFLPNTLLGDLFFSGALFGTYYFVARAKNLELEHILDDQKIR